MGHHRQFFEYLLFFHKQAEALEHCGCVGAGSAACGTYGTILIAFHKAVFDHVVDGQMVPQALVHIMVGLAGAVLASVAYGSGRYLGVGNVSVSAYFPW